VLSVLTAVLGEGEMSEDDKRDYWRANLRLMVRLLSIWFVVSFGFGILLVESLNRIVINDFKLGFWFAQQGSIITFVALIAVYAWRMDRLDAQFGVGEGREGSTGRVR
jgi:putative solute:sodium symporter small subunit